MTRPNIMSFLFMDTFQNVPEAYSRQGHSKSTIKDGSSENLSQSTDYWEDTSHINLKWYNGGWILTHIATLWPWP